MMRHSGNWLKDLLCCKEASGLSENLSRISEIGLQAVGYIKSGTKTLRHGKKDVLK